MTKRKRYPRDKRPTPCVVMLPTPEDIDQARVEQRAATLARARQAVMDRTWGRQPLSQDPTRVYHSTADVAAWKAEQRHKCGCLHRGCHGFALANGFCTTHSLTKSIKPKVDRSVMCDEPTSYGYPCRNPRSICHVHRRRK